MKIPQIILNKQNQKLIAIICISIAVMAIAVTSIILIFQSINEPEEKPSDTFPAQTEYSIVTYPPESPKSLEYRSLEDGSCVIAGIGRYVGSELEIPERSPNGQVVIGISARAFENCDELISIHIPETVIKIGEQAFKGCSSLIMISVESSNTKFCSSGGILFSKDKTTLICYPPQRVGSNYLLNPNVKVICDYAFYRNKNLSKINYEGSTAEFESIKIGKGNEDFSSLPITCTYTPGK